MDNLENIWYNIHSEMNRKYLEVMPVNNTKFLYFEFGIEIEEDIIYLPETLLN